jgi:hypothetical protein
VPFIRGKIPGLGEIELGFLWWFYCRLDGRRIEVVNEVLMGN